MFNIIGDVYQFIINCLIPNWNIICRERAEGFEHIYSRYIKIDNLNKHVGNSQPSSIYVTDKFCFNILEIMFFEKS